MAHPDYQNELIFERNRLPSRAYFIPKHHIILNGQWNFLYASTPIEADVLAKDKSRWTTIEVPGHWQLQGHGNPIYTCIKFPFPSDPPFVPAQNPTGIYQKEVIVPDWQDEIGESAYWLRFEGVDSAFHVYVNGHEVGYNQGARNAAEFDVSHLIQVGHPNVVTVKVYQWSDGSYLEAQDHWWFSGMFSSTISVNRALTGY
jgi:beta-galactosidase